MLTTVAVAEEDGEAPALSVDAYVPIKPKESVEHDELGKRISHIQFGMFGNAEVARLAEFEVVNDRGYEQPSRTPVVAGVLDRRLGVSDKQSCCETCGARLQDCPGHFGYIKLELPVFNIGYLKPLVGVLQCICKQCSRVLLPPAERLKFQKQMLHPMTRSDYIRKSAVSKRILERCKKTRECPHCHALNGVVKKVGCARIVHEKYREKDTGERAVAACELFRDSFEGVAHAARGSFESAQLSGGDITALSSKAQDDLNPLRVKELLSAIPASELALLDMDLENGPPVRNEIDLENDPFLPYVGPRVCHVSGLNSPEKEEKEKKEKHVSRTRSQHFL